MRFAAFILPNGINVLNAKENAVNRKFTKKLTYVAKRLQIYSEANTSG